MIKNLGMTYGLWRDLLNVGIQYARTLSGLPNIRDSIRTKNFTLWYQISSWASLTAPSFPYLDKNWWCDKTTKRIKY